MRNVIAYSVIGVILFLLVPAGYYAGQQNGGVRFEAITTTQTLVQTVTVNASPIIQTVTGQASTVVTTQVSTQTLTQTSTTTVTANPVTRKSDLTIRGVTSGTASFGGYYQVRGEVYNNGTGLARFVTVIATFYDANNNVVCTSLGFTSPSDIYAQEAAPFEVTCIDSTASQKIQSFKLVADMS